VDVFGWVKGPASLDKQTGVYTIYNPSTGQVYVGSALDVGSRISDTNHTKAQELLKLEGTKVEFTLVDLGNAKDWQTQNRILRHFEQQEFLDAQRRFGTDNMLNSNNPEAVKKKARNQGIVDDKGASKGKKINCS
jgi:hypothetical protein